MSDASPGWVTHTISALNGMFGDYLVRRGNGLALGMRFQHAGEPLSLTRADLRAAHPQASRKLCVLVHGLACNESVWFWRDPASGTDAQATQATSYGLGLQRDLGYTPFYLRYNSGLPIAENGAELSRRLAALVENYPAPIDEIVLIGHSMGGLVLRAAAARAMQDGEAWAKLASRLFYLGTPHAGADLEKLVHAGARTLQRLPNPVTRLIGDILNLRSQGVKDLRRGLPLDADDDGAVGLLPHARHYFVMGTLKGDAEHPLARLFGDALVRVPAALPATTDGTAFAIESQVFPGIHHLALAHDPTVYRQIRRWCKA